MRNLREAAPNSSQRTRLVKAYSAAIAYDREKRRNSIQDLQTIGVRQILVTCITLSWNRDKRRTSTSLKPSLADCVAAGAAVEAARLTAGTIVWVMDREMELTACLMNEVANFGQHIKAVKSAESRFEIFKNSSDSSEPQF